MKSIIRKMQFKHKLRCLDARHYLFGGICFSLFPPSFYHTHTPEEIENVINREMERLQQMLDELAARGVPTA